MATNKQTLAFEQDRQRRILALRAALEQSGVKDAAAELKEASAKPVPKRKPSQPRSPRGDEPSRRSDRRALCPYRACSGTSVTWCRQCFPLILSPPLL